MIRRVLQWWGIPSAPVRDTDTTWRQFLRTPASTMLACDFFPVDCAVTRKRLFVFVVLEVANRSVHLLGTTTNPHGRGNHPADPQPRDGPRRSPPPVPAPRLRPSQPVHSIVRCGPGREPHRGRGLGKAPDAMNDPRSATPSVPTWRDTRVTW
jgi:hypothetical protein